jgi:SAM-dependent methyltransferase
MVQHLDSSALESISANYANLIRPDSKVLDLMGSWDSHLPAGLGLKNLTVLGLNPEELAANTEATETVVQDLNQDHNLTFETGSFDAVICTASVEYLTDPLQVFREVERVLRPGGIVAVAFSNRWFPPKAIAVWSQLHEFERLGMVIELLQRTPNLVDIGSLSRRGLPRPEDDPHWELPYSDPVFMVWGRKKENGG